jgi:hypothetical protein
MILKMKDEVFFSEIKIDQMMIGRNVVFVKYTEHAKVKPSHMDKVVEYIPKAIGVAARRQRNSAP